MVYNFTATCSRRVVRANKRISSQFSCTSKQISELGSGKLFCCVLVFQSTLVATLLQVFGSRAMPPTCILVLCLAKKTLAALSIAEFAAIHFYTVYNLYRVIKVFGIKPCNLRLESVVREPCKREASLIENPSILNFEPFDFHIKWIESCFDGGCELLHFFLTARVTFEALTFEDLRVAAITIQTTNYSSALGKSRKSLEGQLSIINYQTFGVMKFLYIWFLFLAWALISRASAHHDEARCRSMACLAPIQEISESESGGEANGPARPIVLRAVDEISSDAEDELHLPRQGARRKRLKRKRSTDLPSMRERLTSESCLKNVLTKKCIKCKFGCREKFSTELKFTEWRKFREHWVSLSKLDQDQIVTWNEMLSDCLARCHLRPMET